jgi:SAM-dependent methyltransferase
VEGLSVGDVGVFDGVAADYDAAFTNTLLGRMLRRRVWSVLAGCFRPGEHVLELACGTGEDALWLARRGVRVTATDGSARMVAATDAKLTAAGLTSAVQARQVSLQQVTAGEMAGVFDGILSNFGGLNSIGDWRSLARALARLVRPGGLAVLVPMGPYCPWEIAWHLLHGRPRDAFRRRQQPAMASIGTATIPVWYPTAGRLRRDFARWFRHLRSESLGLWLPPTYLQHLVDSRPALFARLDRLERAGGRLTASWGDHYILILERKENEKETGISGFGDFVTR